MPFEAPVTTATLPLSLFMGPYLAGAEHRVNDEALARALVRRQSHQRLPWSRLTPGQTMFVSWIIPFTSKRIGIPSRIVTLQLGRQGAYVIHEIPDVFR